MRAPEIGFAGAVMIANLGKGMTDFAEELRTYFPIIVVDVLAWGITVRATNGIKNEG